ncbi:hypothetical protein UNH65_14675 [Chitinophaga sp. 180180018-2]|nr:hypothetical protein [Chitinophaga sp. 212800010-3]
MNFFIKQSTPNEKKCAANENFSIEKKVLISGWSKDKVATSRGKG